MQDMSRFRDLIGVPFVDRGRDPAVGLDCWGLFYVVMRRFGIEVPDYKISCFAAEQIETAAAQALGRQWVQMPTPATAYGVTMTLDPDFPQVVQHFGVCLDGTRMIHTLEKKGVTVTRLDNPLICNLITGYWKWNG